MSSPLPSSNKGYEPLGGPGALRVAQASEGAGVSGSGLVCPRVADSGGVAGVAAQRGGEVAVAAARRMPMARLRRLAMARGALPVRTWEASSAKVTSRMWVQHLDAPVTPDQLAERAGWPGRR